MQQDDGKGIAEKKPHKMIRRARDCILAHTDIDIDEEANVGSTEIQFGIMEFLAAFQSRVELSEIQRFAQLLQFLGGQVLLNYHNL